MKRFLKIFIVAFAIALVMSVTSVYAFANGNSTGVLYKIYDGEGKLVKDGTAANELCDDLTALKTDARVVLLKDINVGETRSLISGTAETPITVDFDLAGNEMIFTGKNNTVHFAVGAHATFNIFSSSAGGHISASAISESGANAGDPVFAVSYATSVLNIGEYKEANGTTYSGDNLTLSAIAMISTGGQNGSEINVKGGTYIRIPTGDHRGFIMLRSGETRVNIKSAKILANGGSMFVLTADRASVLVEDSIISGYGSSDPNLVNIGMTGTSKNSFFAELTLKNSTVFTSIQTPEFEGDDIETATQRGTLLLEGINSFEGSAVDVDVLNGISGVEDAAVARIGCTYSMRGFGREYAYMVLNSETGEYDSVPISIKGVSTTVTVVPQSETADCIISNGVISLNEVWYTGADIEPNVSSSVESVPGVCKFKWSYKLGSGGKRIYTIAPVADFNLLLSYSYHGGVYSNLYIPKVFYEEYMDDLYATYGGKPINEDRFSPAKVGDDEYYKVSIPGVESYAVYLPGIIGGKTFAFEAEISLADYVKELLKAELSAEKAQSVYDLCLYAINYLSDKAEYAEDIAYFGEVITDKALTFDRTDIYAFLNDSATDVSYLAENFGAVGFNTSGVLTVAIPEGYEGTLKIGFDELERVYEIEGGKCNGARLISIILPFENLSKNLTFKLYDESGNLVAKEGDDLTATYSIAECYSGMSDGDRTLLKSALALYYSMSKIK